MSTKNNNDSLYSNLHYFIRVGESLDFNGPTENRLLYQIVNRETEVVEHEAFALPNAIKAADTLNTELSAVNMASSLTAVR